MPLPSSLALTTIADGSTIVASDHRNNYTSIQTNTNQTLGVLGAAWTAYAPVWTTSGTAPFPGNATLTGKFWQVGKYVTTHFDFTAGSTTTFGTGTFFISLPVSIAAGNGEGSFVIVDASAGAVWTGTALLVNPNKMQFLVTGASGANFVAAGVPFTWAVSDTLSATISYEAA